MVSRNHLYVGHMFSNGFTVIATSPIRPGRSRCSLSPRRPTPARNHLQTNGDLMLIVCGADIPTIGKLQSVVLLLWPVLCGQRIRTIGFCRRPESLRYLQTWATPVEIAFLPIPGIGLNRPRYAGGRYAYVSAHMDGFTDHSAW